MKKAVSAFTALMLVSVFTVNAFADAALPYERAADSAIAAVVIAAVKIKKKKAQSAQAVKGASEITEDKTEDDLS